MTTFSLVPLGTRLAALLLRASVMTTTPPPPSDDATAAPPADSSLCKGNNQNFRNIKRLPAL